MTLRRLIVIALLLIPISLESCFGTCVNTACLPTYAANYALTAVQIAGQFNHAEVSLYFSKKGFRIVRAGSRKATRFRHLIIKGAAIGPSNCVLEIGCGTGLFTTAFAESGATIVAVDLSPDLLAMAARRNLNRVRFAQKNFADCDLEVDTNPELHIARSVGLAGDLAERRWAGEAQAWVGRLEMIERVGNCNEPRSFRPMLSGYFPSSFADSFHVG